MDKKSILLFLTIFAGVFINAGYKYAFLIKYLLMLMLFFPFLSVSFPRDWRIYLNVLAIFIAMSGIAVCSYCFLVGWNQQLAMIASLIAFTPTATAAPVMIGLMGKNVDYVVSSVLITNTLAIIVIPFFLPETDYLTNQGETITSILGSIMLVVLAPLFFAQMLKVASHDIAVKLGSAKKVPFYIWLIVIYIATSKASDFLFSNNSSILFVLEIAISALIICILSFLIGRIIGGEKYSIEASQSLGQKNTMLMTWIALEYIGPVAMLGPVFYLIFQNLYNSFLLSGKYSGQQT